MVDATGRVTTHLISKHRHPRILFIEQRAASHDISDSFTQQVHQERIAEAPEHVIFYMDVRQPRIHTVIPHHPDVGQRFQDVQPRTVPYRVHQLQGQGGMYVRLVHAQAAVGQ